MYISGHISILKDLLSRKELKDYFDTNGDFSKKNVFKGVVLLDLPCDNYNIINDHVIIDPKICKIFKLLNIFNDKNKSETSLWQRHKGYFAHLHSMTTDPENTVEKIRNKIITSILGYSLLGFYDDNIFDKNPILKPNSIWIGIILHIITDSYCIAHTIRDKNIKYKIYKKIDISNETKTRINLHDNIKILARKKRIYRSIDQFIFKLLNMSKDIDIDKIDKNQLYNSYKEFRFEYDMIKLINSYKVINNGITINEKKHNDNYGDIVTFQYYLTQPPLLHKKLDILFYLKRDKIMYERMILECIDFLLLFKKALNSGNINEFLKDELFFFLTRTYNINDKYLNDKTNKIYNDKHYLDLKYLKSNFKLTYYPKNI